MTSMTEIEKALQEIAGQAAATKAEGSKMGMVEVKAQVLAAYAIYEEAKKQARYTKYLAAATFVLAVATLALALR